MRVFCAGFNLYEQLIRDKGCILTTFTEIGGTRLLAMSHSFSVLQNKDEFVIKGAKLKKIRVPEVVQIATNEDRILFLNKAGEIFKFEIKSDEFTKIPLMSDKITKITVGSKISVAASDNGRLFNIPTELNFQSGQIAQICAGREHCLILDGRGNVYSFGRGSRGQLGHGNLEDEIEPKLVDALAGIRVSKVASGGWHSCAVSAEGDLYTWGWNGNGQLGLRSKRFIDDVSVMASPQVVDFDDESADVQVCKVACGSRHTVALIKNGNLYGAGWNKYHQLTSNVCKDNMYQMGFLYKFDNAIDVKCGPWCTAVLIND